jgi:hypothetical protein
MTPEHRIILIAQIRVQAAGDARVLGGQPTDEVHRSRQPVPAKLCQPKVDLVASLGQPADRRFEVAGGARMRQQEENSQAFAVSNVRVTGTCGVGSVSSRPVDVVLIDDKGQKVAGGSAQL